MIKSLISDYIDVMHKAEAMTFSMLISKNIKVESLESFNLFETLKAIHKINSVCLNYQENELVLDEQYEVHSVMGCRNEEGEIECTINLYSLSDGETHSIRMREYPHFGHLIKIIESVEEKCEIEFGN
jgi:hypothetical protein